MSISPRNSELKSGISSWFNHNIPLEEWTTNSDSFTLYPGEKCSIPITEKINNDTGFIQLQGEVNGPDLILSNGQGQKPFQQYGSR